MKKLCTLALILCSLATYSQKEANNWYFGENAGIQFNNDGSTSTLSNGNLNTTEGCAAISDSDGNLLFYTDGITVWNKRHQIMPNANGFIGNGLLGDSSSTQSAIIVPKPKDPNIYYIFTVDTSTRSDDPDAGFNYTTIDIRLNNGLGDVVPGSKNINLITYSSEKISAVVKDCVSKSIWVITFASANGNKTDSGFNEFDTFYAYEVSASGINTTPVKSTFNISIEDFRGYLKLSPDGKKLACANSSNGLYLYDFDAQTGKVSNQLELNINFIGPDKPQSAYGVEFSQNSQFLYISSYYDTIDRNDFVDPSKQYSALLQYDLNASNINASEVVLDHRQMFRGALQLGPNGKIYRAMNITYIQGSPYLSVINNPNIKGLDANYKHNAIQLSNNSTQGLPPFISSFFSEKINITQKQTNSTYLPLCIGENYTFIVEDIPGANYIWTRDGMNLPDFNLQVTDPGLYNLLIQSSTGDCRDLLEGEALVEYFNYPVANPINDIIVCNANNKHTLNFIEQAKEGLGDQNPSIYNIKFYKSQEDADLDVNEILAGFENSTNPQTIYTRVGLNGNDTCFDTSVSFNLQIFNAPVANIINTINICDQETAIDFDVFNGLTNIDLNTINSSLLGNQTYPNFKITYHNSSNDAALGINSLPFTYTNKTPFNITVFARIENILNTNCFDVSKPIEIKINPKPKFTNSTLIQCDADGLNDETTHFNLNKAKKALTNNSLNTSLRFFKLLNDAETNTNEILNTNNYKNESNPQVLFVKIINDNTGCENITELTLKIALTKIDNYNANSVCDELNSEDGINTFDLNDITTEIQTANNISFPISYYKTYDDALREIDMLPTIYNNTTPYSQIIFARAENGNACYGISEVLLTINPLPEINYEERIYYCLNKFPETITINAGVLNDNPLNYSYKWSNGDTSYQTQINQIGIYTVDVTNNYGCTKQLEITIEPSNIAVFESPEYRVEDPSNNNTISVFVTGIGTYQYALYNKTNTVIYRDYQDSAFFENVSPGIYTINVKDVKNNCGKVTIAVSVIGFPKYFTPNNDGINDTWQINGTSNIFQSKSIIRIFNRYGKLVKQLNPVDQGWDGSFNGEKLPADDYWFTIILEDGRIFKDHFTLKY